MKKNGKKLLMKEMTDYQIVYQQGIDNQFIDQRVIGQ